MKKGMINQHHLPKEKFGFTLLEVVIVTAIIGILASISIPNFISYRQRAEYAAILANMRNFMDLQELYYLDNDEFYPQYGSVVVPRGRAVTLSELGFRFRKGHKHRYLIYGLNFGFGPWKYNLYYVYVFADNDYNGNGYKDIFYYLTLVRNEQRLYNRYFYYIR